MAAARAATVKGGPVASLIKFIKQDLDPAQIRRAFENVPSDVADRLLNSPVLPVHTFPLALLNQLTIAAAKAKLEPPKQFAERAGRAAARDAVVGVYRFLATLVTPAKLLSRASTLFTTIYDVGTLTVDSQSSTGAEVSLTDFPSEEVGCARITGWMTQLAEHTRVKDIRVKHTSCIARGESRCHWSVSWR